MRDAGCLGFDTSNYTTSVAFFDGENGVNAGRLLTVPSGGLGLRQSDALFQHVKQLPDLVCALREACGPFTVTAVGASTRPRDVEGSYMPCFLAGQGQGRGAAQLLDVPFYPCSHQEGHLAAAAWSAGRMELLDKPMLAWHLSGGTTELLLVRPRGRGVRAVCIGGSDDLSAGQLIDRTGVLLGLSFPAGKALEELGREGNGEPTFSVKLKGYAFSLSGVENKVRELAEKGESKANIARFVLNTISDAVVRTTAAARKKWGDLPVLCSGGVASNSLLRQKMAAAVFAEPTYSTDNGMGPAILAHRALEGEEKGE